MINKYNQWLIAIFLPLLFLLQSCVTPIAFYKPISNDPAIFKVKGMSMWGSSDPIWGSDKSLHFANSVSPQYVDGLPTRATAPGHVEFVPWSTIAIDGGTHTIQLFILDNTGTAALVGTFKFTLTGGREYGLIAIRNPKITTDKLATTLSLLGALTVSGMTVKKGTLDEWKVGDPRDYAYDIKLFDITDSPIKEIVSIRTVLSNTYLQTGK